ncbi:PDF receptor [Sarcoptes scabiei]|nr:PDF receptor [Sarcoptes scabiei]
MIVESICYDRELNTLRIINQLLLPIKLEYETINGIDDAWNAIKSMKIRGAPAIAILGLLSVSVELSKPELIESFGDDTEKLYNFINEKAKFLCSSRPTAVNISKEFDSLIEIVRIKQQMNAKLNDLIESIKIHNYEVLLKDRQINHLIGENGSMAIQEKAFETDQNRNNSRKMQILTHCNTGSLATAGYGTALGVIRTLNSKGLLQKCYCTETRPYNQGSRLTAWELKNDAIPHTLICDSMVALLFAKNKIDAVVVGADRVTSNGDTANKIGTFQIAHLAKSFNVPFYVASPLSTIDWSLQNGNEIEIEFRPDKEMKFFKDLQLAPNETDCWNPSFDVTPSSLITGGIITEKGVFRADRLNELKCLK